MNSLTAAARIFGILTDYSFFSATSFGRSQLQPLLPLLEALPNELHNTVPYLLSFVMGIYSALPEISILIRKCVVAWRQGVKLM